MPFTQAVETIMGNLSAAPPAFTQAPKAPTSASRPAAFTRAIPITMWCSSVWMRTASPAMPTSEGSARTSSGTPTAAISTIPLEALHRPQATRSTCLSQQWICCPTGHCKSWTAKTGVTKTCSPSPGSTSQGRKSKKAACPPHWCGILPNIAA